MLDREPTPLEREAHKVIADRLSWASMHWRTELVDTEAWHHIARAFVAAGWRPQPEPTCRHRRPLKLHTQPCEPGCEYPSTGTVIPSRSSDPDTSRRAEPTEVRAGTQRARLLAAFALEPAVDGLTDEEAADLADGVPYRSEFAKRCSELRAAGLIEPCVDGGTSMPVTRKGVAGHYRIVCQITDAGRATLAGLS